MNAFDLEQDPQLAEKMAAESLAAPSKKGDDIAFGSYTDPASGFSIVYLDFVTDQLLYRASRGKRGWASFRTEPGEMNEEIKEYCVNVLRKKTFDIRRSEEMKAEIAAEIERQNAPAGAPGNAAALMADPPDSLENPIEGNLPETSPTQNHT